MNVNLDQWLFQPLHCVQCRHPQYLFVCVFLLVVHSDFRLLTLVTGTFVSRSLACALACAFITLFCILWSCSSTGKTHRFGDELPVRLWTTPVKQRYFKADVSTLPSEQHSMPSRRNNDAVHAPAIGTHADISPLQSQRTDLCYVSCSPPSYIQHAPDVLSFSTAFLQCQYHQTAFPTMQTLDHSNPTFKLFCVCFLSG
jgi:hypothetical protein